MQPGRLWQIEELFHAALQTQNPDAFLRDACGGDESLRRQAESLLAYQNQAADFIEVPAMELAARKLARNGSPAQLTVESYGPRSESGSDDAHPLPANIGSYRIIRLLGEGGMGVVYEAEQEQPRRVVALKVIRPGLASPELVRRFEQELQALARLQHPGIAQIYDAGSAESGLGPQPYFAMELVRGQSLREYAENRNLNVSSRLELLAKICEAVQHAHQRGLIHRDLKPGNILVDETGQPKILDFGVARITDSDSQPMHHTVCGQLVGTLAYMSPEQVLADPLELDTRSDVYMLGVILYELLARRLPYSLSRNPHTAARMIREAEPAPLGSLNRAYRGDLETIVAKAMEKDRGRRYDSAADLAADIQRYLKDEPITARPPSAGYLLRKFARRRKALVAATVAIFLVLSTGVVANTVEAARARRERDRAAAAEQRASQDRDRALSAERAASMAEARALAERNTAIAEKQRADIQAATATAVNRFLQDDLLAQAGASAQARPDRRPDPDLKVRTALDRAAAAIEGKFRAQPLVEASIRQTIAKTYQDLGSFPEAQRQMERCVELLSSKLGKEHRQTLSATSELAMLYKMEGKFAQAEPLFTKVLELQQRVLGKQHRDTLDTINSLGTLYEEQGKYARAEPLFIKVLELRRRVLGEEHPDTLISQNNLAVLYRAEGKFTRAEPLYSTVLEIKRRVLGAEHPSSLISMSNFGMLYVYQERYAEAEPLLAGVLETRRRVLGDEHPDTLVSLNNLAKLYQQQGRYRDAEPLLAKVLEVRRRVLGAEHPDTLISLSNLARFYQNEGDNQRAEPLFTDALEARRRVLGDEHPDTLESMNDLARLYRDQGNDARAETLLSRVIELQRRVLGAEHAKRLASMCDLGLLYLNQRNYIEAEGVIREAWNGWERTASTTWKRYSCQSLLGAALAGQGEFTEAEIHLVSGYLGLTQRKDAIPASDRVELERAARRIVQLYQAWGELAKVAEWREKLEAAISQIAPLK